MHRRGAVFRKPFQTEDAQFLRDLRILRRLEGTFDLIDSKATASREPSAWEHNFTEWLFRQDHRPHP